MVCARCKSVRYCGASCQRKDWPTHKTDCKRLAEEARGIEKSATAFSNSGEGALLHQVFQGMGSEFASYAQTTYGRDPPETHRPRLALVPGGPAIAAGWGRAFSYKANYMSPLEQAVSEANPRAVQALLASEAAVNSRDSMTAWTPLHYTAMHPGSAAPSGRLSSAILACMRLLLEAGADPNACSKTLNTPLHNVVNFAQSVSVVKWGT